MRFDSINRDRQDSAISSIMCADESVDFADVVGAIGSETFSDQVLLYLHDVYGIDRHILFELNADTISPLCESDLASKSNIAGRQARHGMKLYFNGEYWRRDVGASRGSRGTSACKDQFGQNRYS